MQFQSTCGTNRLTELVSLPNTDLCCALVGRILNKTNITYLYYAIVAGLDPLHKLHSHYRTFQLLFSAVLLLLHQKYPHSSSTSGTYTIGKESVFLESAAALNQPIYVSPTKLQVLQQLPLPPHHVCLLTTNPAATSLRTAMLW